MPSQVAHQAGTYPGFCSMKRPGVFLLPLDGMLVHCKVTPSIKFAGTYLYTWVERGTLRVKCVALQKHNAVPWPGLEPGPLGSESSALTINCASLFFLRGAGRGEGGKNISSHKIFTPKGEKGVLL